MLLMLNVQSLFILPVPNTQVMDADLSHPPEEVAGVAGPVMAGKADFVLASRYMDGGGVCATGANAPSCPSSLLPRGTSLMKGAVF